MSSPKTTAGTYRVCGKGGDREDVIVKRSLLVSVLPGCQSFFASCPESMTSKLKFIWGRSNIVRLVALLRLHIRGETHLFVPLPFSKKHSSSS